MEAIQFAYWLQGALELGQQKAMSEQQVKIIQDHLNLVLNKVTPQYNLPSFPKLGVQPGIRTPGQIQPYDIGQAVC